MEIPGHDRVPLHVSQDTMMTPQIESFPGNESTTPSQNKVIAEQFELKTTLAKNVSKVLGETCEVRTLDKIRMVIIQKAKKEKKTMKLHWQWCNPKSWQSTQPLNSSSQSGSRVSLQSMTAMSQQQTTFELT